MHSRGSTDHLTDLTYALTTGRVKGDPLEWWAKHEHDFPNLGKMARDILAVPASGAGVECLFNIARDICNFRRGRLHGETIRKLMKMCHHDHDVLQQELRPTDPTILVELERKHMEADAHKHDLDSGLQAVISDVSEYETDDPDSDNDYGTLG